jgi:hypothetical protein
VAEGPGPQEQPAEVPGHSAPSPATGSRTAPTHLGTGRAHDLARLDPSLRASTAARLQRATGNAGLARRLQRDPAPADAAAPAAAPAAPAAPVQSAAAGCVVDDASETLEPHQQHRSQVLAALRAAASSAAESALGGSPWASAARGRVASELEALFATYAAQDAATLERSLRAAAPGAAAATTAAALVAAVAAEVGRSVAAALPKDDPLDAGVGAVAGAASAVMDLLFKRRRGARRPAADPVGTLGELGRGRALGGSERGRMEEAFGSSFADVRVHTDSVAADLADRSGARAFSIGRSIAFGAGEYRPGTLEGDALIAHELAHVIQQRDAPAGGGAAPVDDVAALEADADNAAIDATVGLHLGEKGALAGLRRTAVARLRSGIALRSCGPEKKPEIAATQAALGASVKTGMDTKANAKNKTGESGLHYWFNYEANSRRGVPGYRPWVADWQFGYTAAPQFRKEAGFTWRMKPGESPSEALAAWLGGLTIADCASVAVALQHDAIRAAVGNAKFDEIFRLNFLINQYSSPELNPNLAKFLADTKGSAPQAGDLYYFSNHKHYKYKHPAGAWRGENAIYAGNGKWSGFGAADTSEEDMLTTLVDEYDKERTPADLRQIERETRENGGKTPPEYVYGATLLDSTFVEKIKTKDALRAGGGGLAESGVRVDAAKVAPQVPPK